MLKKYQYFFLILFLGSMLFTVFQYIPVLEEEIHASKTMSKKADDTSNENNSGDDTGGDDENDTDDLFHYASSTNFHLIPSASPFQKYSEDYLSIISNITTPPPKF